MSAARVEITPSATQYRQLVANLRVLRDAGAESNTAAIIAAVQRAADDTRRQYDGEDMEMAGQRQNAPGPEPRR